MNKIYIDKFDKYILWVWISILIVLTIQFANNASIQEAFALALISLLSLYPLTTYLSKNLLSKAIKEKKILQFTFQFIGICILMMAIIIVVYFLFGFLEKKNFFPTSQLMIGFDSGINDSVGAFAAIVLINFGFCGLRFFEENLKLHKMLVDSQLQTLKAQINPHFMFNVLNHVHVLIKKEPELASELLIQYTSILRYQLYSSEKDVVKIHQEVQFLTDFISIEKVRWKNNLDVTFDWKIEDREVEFPSLLLITFVENAFKHVSRSKTEKGFVFISLIQTRKTIELEIKNSKFPDEKNPLKNKNSGLGLENIKRRLTILYPAKHKLEIKSSDTVYQTFLKIDL